MKIQRAKMMAPTGKATIVPAVFPNVGVRLWYQARLEHLIHEMYMDSRTVLIPAIEDTPPVVAQDERVRLAAGVMFWCKGRLLLLRRNDKYDEWGLPGGGVEDGESTEQAALRECYEEMRIRVTQPLYFERIQEWHGVSFFTYRADVPECFEPVLNHEHSEFKWATRDEALEMRLHPGVRATLAPLAQDASPTKELQRALERWGVQWIKKFDLMSQKLSLEFASRSTKATETAMQGAFKRAGFTVPFKPTRASIQAYTVVAAEQVGLIKSIAQKYHSDIQTMVWESVKRGGDLKTLSANLTKTYGVTKRRAALIARDQNAKAKAVIEAVRHKELGIRQGIWMHSHGGKVPRPTHVKMNNKLFDLDKGMWDSDEQKYIQPGELINCGCTFRPFIPGFEDIKPEWDMVQT